MSKAEDFEDILGALEVGAEGIEKSVRIERPHMFEGLPPEQVRAIVHIDECAYSVTIECVASS
jgi:hypothetical protein